MAKVKKIVVLGAVGAGKSALLNKLTGVPFSRNEIPTMGLRIYSLPLKSDVADKLVFWELTSAGRLETQPIDYLKGAHVAIYIFDLSRPSTYLKLKAEQSLLSQILPNVPVLFVANKADLVSNAQAEKLRSEFSDLSPLLVSAKDNSSTQEIIDQIIKYLA
jgi:small GTP-binding protein